MRYDVWAKQVRYLVWVGMVAEVHGVPRETSELEARRSLSFGPRGSPDATSVVCWVGTYSVYCM